MQYTGKEVVYDDICLANEFEEEVFVGGEVEIERNGEFVAVNASEVCAEPSFIERRPPVSGIIASSGNFDFNYIGAELCECHGSERPGEDPGEIENSDIF